MNAQKSMMCSPDSGHLSHLRQTLRAVDLLETHQKFGKCSSRWRQVQTDNDFPVPQRPRGKPYAARCLGIFYPKQFIRQTTAELATKPNYVYPIAFDKAVIYGAEGKLNLVRLGKLSGYARYSYMVGNVWFPVTGGLFLGDDASAALTQLNGRVPDSQDQRNTFRTRFQYQLMPRIWLAAELLSGSALPFEFDEEQSDALAQYGPAVVNRLNFDRGRVDPSLSVQASIGADVYKSDKITTHFQADCDNLNNRLNVIDFGGLFSGNAIGPARSFSLRLDIRF
jgi:hypothetical protein